MDVHNNLHNLIVPHKKLSTSLVIMKFGRSDVSWPRISIVYIKYGGFDRESKAQLWLSKISSYENLKHRVNYLL